MNFTLTQEQYEALISLARTGTRDHHGQVLADKARNLNDYLKQIEKANGVTRHGLWVQWQEVNTPLPPGVAFPNTWPPEMRAYIEFLTRPVNATDVAAVIKARAKNPVNILVTPDPGAVLGWTALADYFIR